LAFICSAAPQARTCLDPAETQKFLMTVTMARGFGAGIPMFSTPQKFINAMSGKGNDPFSMIFKSIGMEPIPFLSPQEAAKALSVESKLFSIYATGTVKAGKRETRVRIHAVVDFRNAPPPGAATTLAQMAQAQQAAAGKTANTGSISGMAMPGADGTAPNPNDPNTQMAALLKPTPGGTIIHYKVE